METDREQTADDIALQVEQLVADSTALMDKLIENMRNQREILERFMRMAPQEGLHGD